jgi:ferredoxin
MFDSYLTNTLLLDPARCNGCGMCAAVCPHGVFAVKHRQVSLVRQEACMECGACQVNCPTGAITVESGVGCAAAMFRAALTGRKEPTC